MLGQVASALTLLFSIVTEATPVPPSDYELIRSTLAKYPLSIDSKQFSDLSQVFSENAIGNYGPPLNTLSGLNDIEAVLEDSLANVTTQHAYSTQLISVLSDTTANTTTYYTASHFGMREYEGQVVYGYGRYEDQLVKLDEGWRIQKRDLIYMGPILGNLSIFG